MSGQKFDPMEFYDKVAIITGSAQGIGKEMALNFAKQGAKVVIADINKEKAEEVVKEIGQTGGKSLAVKTDVTDMESIKDLIKETQKSFGEKIDILANVAGVCIQEDIFESTEKSWDLTMDINLKGMFFLSKEVAKVMAKFKEGKIINISSTSGYITSTRCSMAYDVSKAAVRMLTTGLAEWLGPYNINVNGIAPATTKTQMITDLFGDDYFKGEWVSKSYPLGRIAEPVDIANAALFLCSEDARNITGHTLLVDGGCLLVYRRK